MSQPFFKQSFNEKEGRDIEIEINNLIIIGAVQICSYHPDQYVSRIFLADKPNVKKRFILNLKQLNKFIRALHFKLDDARTATRLILKGPYPKKSQEISKILTWFII